ncbi:MAG: hypothetical protein QM676_01155 [Novosphingobium sp.]
MAEIRALRAVAERLAQSRAVDIARDAEAQHDRCREEDAKFGRVLDDWHCSLTADRFDPMAVAIRSLAVTRQDAARAQSREDLAALRAELETARTDYSRSQANSRCAADLLDRARRRHRRLREEKSLAQRDDRNAARVAVS